MTQGVRVYAVPRRCLPPSTPVRCFAMYTVYPFLCSAGGRRAAERVTYRPLVTDMMAELAGD